MKPFCIASVGAILAIFVGLYLYSIAPFFQSFILLFLFIGISGISIKLFFKQKLKSFCLFAICFIVFFSYIMFLERGYETIINTYGEQEVKIQGIIISKAEQTEYKDAYQIRVTQIENLETNKIEHQNFKLLGNIKKTKDSKQLNYGDKIEFTAVYEVPSTARNEGGFDYSKYLKTNQIKGIVTINSFTKIAKNQVNYFSSNLYKLKTYLIEKISNTLPQQSASMCIALLLGDKSYLSEETKDNFKQSNLSHMLAISGAHISYLLLGITTFLNKLKLHKRWSKILIIFFLIFFMALVDFSPSVTRACIMCILTLIAEILFRKSDVYQNLAISALVILVVNPYTLLDIGFQLSFGGTIGIVLFMRKDVKTDEENKEIEELNRKQNREKNNTNNIEVQRKWTASNKAGIINKYMNSKKTFTTINKTLNNMKQITKVSLSANLVIIPIMLYHFNTISATFFISNMLATHIFAITLITGLIFIVLLIICFPLANILSYFLNFIMQIFIQITNLTSQMPLSQILLPTPKIVQICIYYLLLYFLFNKNEITNYILIFFDRTLKKHLKQHVKKLQKMIIILLILILILPYFLSNFPTNYLNIHCIDVGQRRQLFDRNSI